MRQAALCFVNTARGNEYSTWYKQNREGVLRREFYVYHRQRKIATGSLGTAAKHKRRSRSRGIRDGRRKSDIIKVKPPFCGMEAFDCHHISLTAAISTTPVMTVMDKLLSASHKAMSG